MSLLMAQSGRGFFRLLCGHRHHVAVEVGDDPDRAGDDKKDDEHAKGEGQNIIRAVGSEIGGDAARRARRSVSAEPA